MEIDQRYSALKNFGEIFQMRIRICDPLSQGAILSNPVLQFVATEKAYDVALVVLTYILMVFL